jgi:hypothetical protein
MAGAKSIIREKMENRRLELIEELWPGLDPKVTWHRLRAKGFITIPRCMPYILDILNQLSAGNPLSTAYLTLWCHSHDEGLVEIKNEQEIAFECGFKGQRAVATWKNKMKVLKEYGFIDAHNGKCGDYSYVLIYNPFRIIKEIYKSGNKLIAKESYIALVQRAQEVGAKDINE